MLQIVINGKYYPDNTWFSSWNARQKKECVFFYDYDNYIGYIIRNMEFSDLQRLRLKLFNLYKKQIKYTKFGEENINGEIFTGWKLESNIIEVPSEVFFNLLERKYKKNYLTWDSFRERYFLNSKFINYVNLNVI